MRVDHDHRTFLIDLTEAHTIASLESTIERRRNWEVELVQFLKIFFKKNINCISPVASKIYFKIIKKYLIHIYILRFYPLVHFYLCHLLIQLSIGALMTKKILNIFCNFQGRKREDVFKQRRRILFPPLHLY